jgi:hypothetical protein
MKSNAGTSPEALFQAVATHHGGVSGFPHRRGFGADALKVNGKIFATLSKGRLLLKLPSERVDALIASNLAERFSTGVGRVKKEWVMRALLLKPARSGRSIPISPRILLSLPGDYVGGETYFGESSKSEADTIESLTRRTTRVLPLQQETQDSGS